MITTQIWPVYNYDQWSVGYLSLFNIDVFAVTVSVEDECHV